MANETQSWWKKGLWAALIGAVIPVATFVQGWMQKNRELALQEQQQIQQFRAQYMSVLAETGIEGMEVLADFIADTERDPTIREWAIKQREKARSKVADLEKRLEAERLAAEAAKVAAQAAEQKTERLAARATAPQPAESPGRRAEVERAAAEARGEWARAQAAAAASESKVARMRAALTGRPATADRKLNVAAPPK